MNNSAYPKILYWYQLVCSCFGEQTPEFYGTSDIILKIKLRYWTLSIGIIGFLANFMINYDLPKNLTDVLFIMSCTVQLFVISVYFIIRFVIRYRRARKSETSNDSGAWSTTNENFQKATGQN
jgi:phage shock protein PspC (stress-responsive transcriptional regulator)